MRELLTYVLLGAIQGATEFLPVSSSGHLAAAQHILGVEAPGLLVEVCLHLGTLLAIVAVFRKDIAALLLDTLKGGRLLLRHQGDLIAAQAPMFPMAVAIAIGTVPVAVAGLSPLYDVVERISQDMRISGLLICVTGAMLLVSRFAPAGRSVSVRPLAAVGIGLAQVLALAPGISRSGATITAGYFLGIERGLAARFSFLLAAPALAGAMVLETGKLLAASGVQEGGAALTRGHAVGLACGTLVAGAVGWLCLRWLFAVVARGRLHWFSAYCIPVGIVFFALSYWI